MPDTPMPDIFVSYTEADRPIARYIALDLQSRGAAPRSHSLEACDQFLLIYSPRAAADPQIKAEIVAALLQDKPVAVLIVEPSPLTLPDFPLLLDSKTAQFTLSAPEEAETTLNAMAAHYGLPQQTVTPPLAALFDHSTPSEETAEGGQIDFSKPHASGIEFPTTQAAFDLVLFRASALGETHFGAALTLLLWMPRFGGDFIGAVRGYRDQRMSLIRARWVQQLEKQAQAALQADDDAELATLAQTIQVLDPQNPLVRQLQGGLRERRTVALWERIQAQADVQGWTSVGDLLDQMRAVSPLDTRTVQASERHRSEIECADLADIAQRTAIGGYERAFAHLMQYIQQRCPDFQEVRKLLANLRLTPELVEYLQPKHVLRGGAGVQTMVFSPDGTLLVSGGTDGILRLWDMEHMQQVARQNREDGGLLSLAYSPDGMLLVSASESGIVRLWQMPEGREVITIDEFSDRVTCVCFTPDGQALICGGNNGAVQIVRIEDGLVLYDSHADVQAVEDDTNSNQRHRYAVTSLALTQLDNGETLLLTSSDDKTVKVWRVDDSSTLTFLHSLVEHSMIVRDAVFSQTEPLIAASVGNDSLICLWSPETGELLGKLYSETANQIRAAVFVPGTSLLASAGTDRIVTLWDTASPLLQPLRQLTRHAGSINTLAFSRDGLWLASGSSDHTIVLWHL